MDNNTKNDRREFLKTTGKAGLAAGLSLTILPALATESGQTVEGVKGLNFFGENIPYTQQPLAYGYADLEPVIDSMTMEIHYLKHAAAYAKNLADAVAAEGVDSKKISLTALLADIGKYSAKMRNNAGGHYNHEFFWKSMQKPSPISTPTGGLLKQIEKDLGSLGAFKKPFW